MSADLIERIHARCIEEGDCLIWQDYSKDGKHPQIKIAGKVYYVRKVLWGAQNGEMPAGKVLAKTCETRNCVCHTEPQTVSEIQTRVGATGVFSTPQRGAKIAAAKRAACGKISMEQALDIRNGAASVKEMAKRYGICPSLAGGIRRGERWKEYGANPFAGLMA